MTVHESYGWKSANPIHLFKESASPASCVQPIYFCCVGAQISASRNDVGQRRHGNLRGSCIARMDYKDFCLTCLVTLAAINTVLNWRSQRRR